MSLNPGRQSPFRRQPSTNSPTPLRALTPTPTSTSPTKSSLLSPARGGSLPPERHSIYGRQSSQNDVTTAPDNVFRREGSLSPIKDNERRASATLSKTQLDTPVRRVQQEAGASPSLSVLSPNASPTTQILHSSESPALVAAQAAAKIRQPVFGQTAATKPAYSQQQNKSTNAYNSIPAPLLRSFRESFEVLDPNATGSLNAASLPPVLDQLGLANDASLNNSYFPRDQAQNMNLAAYLDLLSAPFSELSSQEELAAAFGAFDVDDSGQIDVHDLRQALLRTMPEPGEVNGGAALSEAEVDSVLQSFTGRRAFGSRGLGAQKASGKDVFKWREFVGNLNGGVDDQGQAVAV